MRKPARGQALVIILLVLAIAATISLSLVARTITDVTITTKEKEASRAFSAAEAGVERALLIGGSTSGTLPSGETYNVTVTGAAVGQTYFNAPDKLWAGDTLPLWFVSHDNSGKLSCSGLPCFSGTAMDVCWGDSGTPQDSDTTPAVEVAVLYTQTPGDYKTVRVGRAAVDPYQTRRASGVGGDPPNSFDAPSLGSCTIAGVQYAFKKTVQFSSLGIPSSVYGVANGLQIARIRLIYNTDKAHGVGISVDIPGNGTLPSQGQLIESTGIAEQSTRKIQVFQLFPDLPPIFDFALFSTGSLVK